MIVFINLLDSQSSCLANPKKKFELSSISDTKKELIFLLDNPILFIYCFFYVPSCKFLNNKITFSVLLHANGFIWHDFFLDKSENLATHVVLNELWEKVGNSMVVISVFGKLECWMKFNGGILLGLWEVRTLNAHGPPTLLSSSVLNLKSLKRKTDSRAPAELDWVPTLVMHEVSQVGPPLRWPAASTWFWSHLHPHILLYNFQVGELIWKR